MFSPGGRPSVRARPPDPLPFSTNAGNRAMSLPCGDDDQSLGSFSPQGAPPVPAADFSFFFLCVSPVLP
ncbi:MAG: hypothetical protein BJ554DRAFT_7241 [Olpidium bornovanus]|uniref:Uncharacterized protein n=1 Tax=Olpidium bornovanus TaxID=278681 RepID=A0A8H7ZWS6_9FUNG|nr:MAG: hypothetical protein BJ554DRAFT_7241 [Olpidium bornovanus]